MGQRKLNMDDALVIPAWMRKLYTHHRTEGTGYLVVSGGVIGSITYIYYTVPEAYLKGTWNKK